MVDLFVRESNAYERLKAKGLCEQGVVPDFHGTISNIQPRLWPDLEMFQGDEMPLNAILLEYVANMESIYLSNFASEYLQELGRILQDIHLAGILHGDPMPRNMMISRDQDQGRVRVLWVDFDSAKTFSQDLSVKQRSWIEEENELMDYFTKALVSC